MRVGELTVQRAGTATETIPFDRILVATGRSPRTGALGLERVGVEVDDKGAVIVDATLRTTARSVYAVGDVTGLLPFTHIAAHLPAWRRRTPSSTRGARPTTLCRG